MGTVRGCLEDPSGGRERSITKVLCTDGGCLTATGDDLENDLTAWDYGPLTPNASRHVADALFAPGAARMDKAQTADTPAPQ